ncbi:T9SS type A sorting domain-containing protein [bacterium]|nr:T9SS type A sorting domain-containing protein [bacterium]
MKITLKQLLFILFIYSGMKVELMAQSSFSIDSSFTPFLDFTQSYLSTGGRVFDLWEDPKNGNIYVVGDFNQQHNGKFFKGNVCYTPSGSLCPNYEGVVGTDLKQVYPINDTSLILIKESFIHHSDFNGTPLKQNLYSNLRESVPCMHGAKPYFYKDGSALVANSHGSHDWSCLPIYNGDTLYKQYIIKVDPEGIYDSTFQHSMNFMPTGFIPYDSNRIFVFGLNHKFTIYDGHTVNGLCRIFLNGDIDTTFENPIVPGNNNYNILPTGEDGKFFIHGGTIYLKDHPGKTTTLARFNSDGSLDTTFMNFKGAEDTTGNTYFGVGTITKTEDNGYLVSGLFSKYQGYVKNGMVKLDSTGKLEPQYFNNFIGPDSSIVRWGTASIINIEKSINGGYYIYGDFKYWDGKPSQPIIKIHGMSVGLDEKKQSAKTQLLQAVYPNPTNSTVNLIWLPNQQINQVQVIDIQGRVIQSINQNLNQSGSYQINLEKLNNGIYFLKVFGKEGVQIKKLIKK